MKVEVIETVRKQPNIPIYCRKCRSQNSFNLSPKNDIKFENGKVFQEAWACSECGNIVRYPIENNKGGE